jgi:hypothetical protein
MTLKKYLHAKDWDGTERRMGRDDDYDGGERRHANRQRAVTAADLQERYIAQQFQQIESELAAGNLEKMTCAQTEILNDIKEIMQFSRSGLKLLGWFGVAARWIAGIAGAFLAVYALLHATGSLPKGKP